MNNSVNARAWIRKYLKGESTVKIILLLNSTGIIYKLIHNHIQALIHEYEELVLSIP